MSRENVAVIALGGNAISPGGEIDTIPNQFRHTRESLSGVVELVRAGYRPVITHGNGPQVGNAMLRVEMARGKAPELPLGVCVADVAGGMGYMIEQSLQNRLHCEGLERDVATVVTQVLVERDDPSVRNPSKFVGGHYSLEDAINLRNERNWKMEEDGENGWRRVVPSPLPERIISAGIIKRLVEDEVIVVTAGGGGIPVYQQEDGMYEGVDAVVDKDRTSAVLALEIGAQLLLILTDVEKVALDYGTAKQRNLDRVGRSQMAEYFAEGHFPESNMGPKIEAALEFLSMGGERVAIAGIGEAFEAVEGKAGTQIVLD